jgi:hypothetical protein
VRERDTHKFLSLSLTLSLFLFLSLSLFLSLPPTLSSPPNTHTHAHETIIELEPPLGLARNTTHCAAAPPRGGLLREREEREREERERRERESERKRGF